MNLDYVDLFYSHRPDPNTPLEETMSALDRAVRSGKALYAGISNYDPAQTKSAIEILRKLGTPCLIHQVQYSMFNRTPEEGLFDVLNQEQVGCIAFSPLAQGLLTDRYLKGLPADSRAARSVFLKPEQITPQVLEKIRSLEEIAKQRGQTLAQMAVAWALRNPVMTSVIIGASRLEQLEQNVSALKNLAFSTGELLAIDKLLAAQANTRA
jgi:L-glyceraldehyde 3-phosphate reductase